MNQVPRHIKNKPKQKIIFGIAIVIVISKCFKVTETSSINSIVGSKLWLKVLSLVKKLNLDDNKRYHNEDNVSSGILKKLIYSVSSFKLNSVMDLHPRETIISY